MSVMLPDVVRVDGMQAAVPGQDPPHVTFALAMVSVPAGHD